MPPKSLSWKEDVSCGGRTYAVSFYRDQFFVRATAHPRPHVTDPVLPDAPRAVYDVLDSANRHDSSYHPHLMAVAIVAHAYKASPFLLGRFVGVEVP